MNDFEFGEPGRLLWLWALIPLSLVFVFAARKARARREALLSRTFFERLATTRTTGAEVTRLVFLMIGLCALLLALARPRFGFRLEEVRRRGADLVIAIDVSRSMLSRDVPPSRLERAKMYVRDLLDATRGDRVALVAFAGKAVPLCPLTVDHGFFTSALDDISPDSAPRGGTAIGDAIRTSVDLLERDPERDAAIVLITDGEDHESFPLEAAAVARERGVKIFSVGIGDPGEGAKVPGKDAGVMSFEGKEVVSKMDESLLTQIAFETSGAYVPARTGTYNLGQVYTDHLEKLRAAELSTEKRRRFVEQFQWFAAFGLVFLVMSRILDSSRRRTAVVAALVLSLAMPAQRASAAEAALTEQQVSAVNTAVEAVEVGRFAEAIALLDAVPRSAPETEGEAPAIALVRGVALLALDEQDDAKAAFERASGGSDPQTTLRARYNLGSLETYAAKTLLGEEPEAASGEVRTNALDALDRARDHFRAALLLDPEHADAQHNLELLRLYVKNLKDIWKKRDEAKQEQEKQDEPWLDQLERLGTEQAKIQRELIFSKDAAELAPLSARERALAEELPQLAEKMKTEFEKPPQQGAPGASPPQEESEEQKKAKEQILAAIAEIGRRVEIAAEALDRADGAAAAGEVQIADKVLASVFLSLAPYERILKRGIEWQESLVKATSGESELAPNNDSMLQRRIGPLAELLVQHAERELPQLEQMPEPQLPEGLDEQQRVEAEKQLQKQKEALAGRKESMKRAIDRAPALPPLVVEAADLIAKPDAPAAALKVTEIERILKEIAEPLRNDDQDQDPNQDEKQNEEQGEPKDEKQDEKQDESKDKKEKPQEPQDLTQEKIDELLKQAKDREKEFEKKKKELLKAFGVPVKVEKDW